MIMDGWCPKMPVLENAQHEAFARALAQGMSPTLAYERAGYKRNTGNAARLKADDGVKKRVRELQEQAAADLVVTVDTVTAELEEVRRGAMEDASWTAAVRAIEIKAKLHGVLVDRVKSETTIKDERDISDAELAAIAAAGSPRAAGEADSEDKPAGLH